MQYAQLSDLGRHLYKIRSTSHLHGRGVMRKSYECWTETPTLLRTSKPIYAYSLSLKICISSISSHCSLCQALGCQNKIPIPRLRTALTRSTTTSTPCFQPSTPLKPLPQRVPSRFKAAPPIVKTAPSTTSPVTHPLSADLANPGRRLLLSLLSMHPPTSYLLNPRTQATLPITFLLKDNGMVISQQYHIAPERRNFLNSGYLTAPTKATHGPDICAADDLQHMYDLYVLCYCPEFIGQESGVLTG